MGFGGIQMIANMGDVPSKRCKTLDLEGFQQSRDCRTCDLRGIPLIQTIRQAKGGVWNGGGWNRQISGPEIQTSGPEISSKIPCFAGNFGIPQKFQALKFQNSGPEIWRIRPPPFHTPPFACLTMEEKGQKRWNILRCWNASLEGVGWDVRVTVTLHHPFTPW